MATRSYLAKAWRRWKKIFEVAEKTGGVEFYLIEQEGSAYPEMETAQRCLAAYNKIHR